jgi:hypothetical protein
MVVFGAPQDSPGAGLRLRFMFLITYVITLLLCERNKQRGQLRNWPECLLGKRVFNSGEHLWPYYMV